MTIAFITVRERNENTGRMEDIVDRAFILETEKTVVLPCETPQSLGARWDNDLGLWLLEEGTPKNDPRSMSWRQAA